MSRWLHWEQPGVLVGWVAVQGAAKPGGALDCLEWSYQLAAVFALSICWSVLLNKSLLLEWGTCFCTLGLLLNCTSSGLPAAWFWCAGLTCNWAGCGTGRNAAVLALTSLLVNLFCSCFKWVYPFKAAFSRSWGLDQSTHIIFSLVPQADGRERCKSTFLVGLGPRHILFKIPPFFSVLSSIYFLGCWVVAVSCWGQVLSNVHIALTKPALCQEIYLLSILLVEYMAAFSLQCPENPWAQSSFWSKGSCWWCGFASHVRRLQWNWT